MHRGRLALVALVGAALTACSSPATQPSSDTRTATSSPAPSASSPTNNAERPRELFAGLTSPWGLIALPSANGATTVMISERDTKKIRLITDGQARDLLTIDEADPSGEGGLLGLTAAPDEKTIYAYFTAAADNRIVAMSWDGNTLGDPRPILTGIPKGGRHNGGRMVFGPDGNLYVGTGETGDSALAQDKESLGGKILRITPEGKPAEGNPFGNEVYSYGHRNVEGLAFDDGGRLWASEFGEQTWDELNLITEGGNYGWPEIEGSGQAEGMINPAVVWSTAEASPSGLAYWKASLWMAGLRGERLWQIPLDGKTAGIPKAHLSSEFGRLRSVVVNTGDDALLVTNSNTAGRGDATAGDDRLLEFTP